MSCFKFYHVKNFFDLKVYYMILFFFFLDLLPEFTLFEQVS